MDLLEALRVHWDESGRELTTDPACAMYQSLLLPPEDLRATQKDIVLAGEFFLDYAAQIAQSLAFFSLAGGFARSIAIALTEDI